MKAFLLLSLLALPLQAEVRAAARGGVYDGHPVGAIEVEGRTGNWAFAPAFELIQGGHDLHAIHVDVRRLFRLGHEELWVGGGPTFVRTNVPASKTTWNVDAGLAWRLNSAWQPFVAARYYSFRMPIFRDVIEDRGAALTAGVSLRLTR